MKNRIGGLIHGRHVQAFSASRFRSGRIPTGFLPTDGRWPRVGSLLRIPQTVVLSSANDASQNFTGSGLVLSTPDLETEVAFVRAREIIESARPGRTFVFLRGQHRGPDIPGWPRYANDLPFDIHEDIPRGSSDQFLPSLLVLQYGDPNVNRRDFNDGTDSVLIPFARSAVACFPGVAVRLWDDGRVVTIGGIRQRTISDSGPGRAAQFRSVGLDYQFMGTAPAPLDGDEIVRTIAGHFGFDL